MRRQTPGTTPQRRTSPPVPAAAGRPVGRTAACDPVGGLVLAATVAAVAVAVGVGVQTNARVPAMSAIGLLVAAAWAIAGYVTGHSASIPVVSLGAVVGRPGWRPPALRDTRTGWLLSPSPSSLTLTLALWFHWLLASGGRGGPAASRGARKRR